MTDIPAPQPAERRRRGRPPRTDRDTVVAVARQIVVEEGLSKLTMRRLGAALDVDPMVPYRFFKTKDDLLEAIFLSILEDIAPEPGPDPVTTVAQSFLDFRRVLIDVPNLFALVSPRLLNSPVAMRPAEWVIRQLQSAGLSAADAFRWNTVLLSYVVGSLSFTGLGAPPSGLDPAELPRGLATAVAEAGAVDFEQHFEWGFERLIRQLREDVATP